MNVSDIKIIDLSNIFEADEISTIISKLDILSDHFYAMSLVPELCSVEDERSFRAKGTPLTRVNAALILMYLHNVGTKLLHGTLITAEWREQVWQESWKTFSSEDGSINLAHNRLMQCYWDVREAKAIARDLEDKILRGAQ